MLSDMKIATIPMTNTVALPSKSCERSEGSSPFLIFFESVTYMSLVRTAANQLKVESALLMLAASIADTTTPRNPWEVRAGRC